MMVPFILVSHPDTSASPVRRGAAVTAKPSANKHAAKFVAKTKSATVHPSPVKPPESNTVRPCPPVVHPCDASLLRITSERSERFVSARSGSDTEPSPKPVDDPLCSLSANQEDPGKLLQILSAQTGKNLLLLNKSEAKVTVQLSGVPLSEMIHHLCALTDLAFLRSGPTYVLASPERLKAAYPKEWDAEHPSAPAVAPPAKVTASYRTNFVSANQIVETLTKVFGEKELTCAVGPASITPDLGSQDSSKSTGTSTTVLTKSSGSDGGTVRTVVLFGTQERIDQALQMIRALDAPRTQVCIAVRIDDISNESLKKIGLSWTFGNVGLTETTPSGISFGTFNRTAQTLSATLDLLEEQDKGKLLAAPSISLLDGEKAFVLIGNRISYPVLVGYSQSNSPIFSKEEERVGIYLQVAATVGSDESVTLSLYPQVSSITGYLNLNGASYPQIATREAQSTLRLKSGESLVMGGLFKDEEVTQLAKVPVLGDVPILKELFRHRYTTKSASQVIITVTPTIIRPQEK